MGGVCILQAAHTTFSSSKTLPSTIILEMSCHSFPGGQTCVHRGVASEHYWFFFLLFFLFYLLALNFMSVISKIKCVILVCICIDFRYRSFDRYLCLVLMPFEVDFFSLILSLNILLHLICISNLISIFFIVILIGNLASFFLISSLQD